MSYSRWSSDSDWYVFWEQTKADRDAAANGTPKPKSEEVLAVWRCRREEKPRFNYAEVSEILRSGDFARIPGFERKDQELLSRCMTAFIDDVDRDEKYRD